MISMLIRRLLLGVVTVWIVSVIIFAGVEMLPGDACTAFLERDAKGEMLAHCREAQGLNQPPVERYLSWAAGAIQGDFGTSMSGDQSISEMVGLRVKLSLMLAMGALIGGVPLAIFLGVVTGIWRDRPLDVFLSTGAIFAMTIPEFISATILILIFSIWLGWVPGIVITPADAPVLDFFPEFILPIVVLGMVMTAHIMRMVRTSVIEVMASDYVQMATLKGVPFRQIVFRHVLPNALLPAINVVALTVAWLLGGVVVVEMVFNYPGLGRMMVDAISDRDLPVVQAIAMIVATTYVCVNLTADVMTMILNPRLRTLYMRAK